MSAIKGSSQAKGAVGAIAYAQPDSGRGRGIADAAGDEILVLRDYRPPTRRGEIPDAAVVRVAQPKITDWRGGQTVLNEPVGEGGRQLRIHQNAHGSAGDEDGVVEIARSVSDAGADVFRLEVGKIGEDFILRCAACEHVEHVLDPDAHPPDARASTALVRIDGNALEFVHRANLAGFKRGRLACRLSTADCCDIVSP